MKRHQVIVGADTSKEKMANKLMMVRGQTIPATTLESILPLLNSQNAKRARKTLAHPPIHNYRGLWKPRPKPVSSMSRKEVIRHLRAFRSAWERVTKRNQDLSNEAMDSMSTTKLKKRLSSYFSQKHIARHWLVNIIPREEYFTSRDSSYLSIIE